MHPAVIGWFARAAVAADGTSVAAAVPVPEPVPPTTDAPAQPVPQGPQGPTPARQCADAAAGSEVEVCLRVAVENPAAVEEVVAALLAHIDRFQTPDRTLLDAVLLLSTNRAVEGARLLGALNDPRAVPVLFGVADGHGAPEVVDAAIAALSSYPQAIPELGSWLVDRDRPLAVRLAVSTSLGEARAPRAAEELQDALRRRLPPALTARIADTLVAYYGASLDALDLPPSTDGAPWLAAAWSAGLAYAGGTAGHFGVTELAPAGALTGAVTGASVGWLYARTWPMEAGDAATIATLGMGGAAAGTLIGAGLASPDAERPADVPLLVGLGGEAVGFTLGVAVERVFGRDSTGGDAVEAAILGGIAATGAEAAGLYLRANGTETRRAIGSGLAVIGGLTLGEIVAPGFTIRDGAGWVASGAVFGFAGGMLTPIGPNDRTLLPVATAAGGASLGFVFGAAHAPQDALIGGATGGVFGAGIGVGSGLLAAPASPDLARGLGLAGMLAGYAVGFGVARADPDPIDDRDVAIAMAAGGWAAWDAFAFTAILANRSRLTTTGTDTADGTSTRSIGAVLLASSIAAGGASALNLALDIPVPHTLSASSIGLFGGYAGAAIGDLVGVGPFVLSLPLSNVGWFGGAVLVSPLIGAPPLVIGIADTGGALGAAFAATTAGLLTKDQDAVVLASLGGASVGVVVGGVLGERWHRSGTRRDIALGVPAPRGLPGFARLHLDHPLSVAVAPSYVEGGGGASISVSGW